MECLASSFTSSEHADVIGDLGAFAADDARELADIAQYDDQIDESDEEGDAEDDDRDCRDEKEYVGVDEGLHGAIVAENSRKKNHPFYRAVVSFLCRIALRTILPLAVISPIIVPMSFSSASRKATAMPFSK